MIRSELCDAQQQPVAVVGAGSLVSHVYRDSANEYVFNILRLNEQLEPSQVVSAEDLRDLVKLCQVLAFAICDDGWLTNEGRAQLIELNSKLDEITRDWSEARHG